MSSTTELDGLYNPSINDLMLDEYQGKERPVIYLDDAKSQIKHLILKARIDENRISAKDEVSIQSLRKLKNRLRELQKELGDEEK